MTLPHEIESAEAELHDEQSRSDQLQDLLGFLFSNENINLKTVLDSEQVVALTLALSFAEEFKVELIQKVALFFMQLKVSEKAKGKAPWGRGDMRAVLTSMLRSEEREDGSKEYDRLVNR